MNRTVVRLYRVVMLLYPAAFRRRYRDDMIQLLVDQQRHAGRSSAALLWREALDAVRTAPRMRWESPMNRTVILVVAGTAAVVAALTAQVLLLPLAALAVGAWLAWGRRPQPVTANTAPHHWVRWLVAGVLAIALAVAIPAIDGGELSEAWWTVAAVSLLGGIAMVMTAVAFATGDRAHRTQSSLRG